MDACIIMTTFENEAQAKPVISRLITDKLVACVQTTEIKSHYTWNDEVHHDSELLVMLKTTKALSDNVERVLEDIHPYDTPEIMCIDASTSAGYGAWMKSVTRDD